MRAVLQLNLIVLLMNMYRWVQIWSRQPKTCLPTPPALHLAMATLTFRHCCSLQAIQGPASHNTVNGIVGGLGRASIEPRGGESMLAHLKNGPWDLAKKRAEVHPSVYCEISPVLHLLWRPTPPRRRCFLSLSKCRFAELPQEGQDVVLASMAALVAQAAALEPAIPIAAVAAQTKETRHYHRQTAQTLTHALQPQRKKFAQGTAGKDRTVERGLGDLNRVSKRGGTRKKSGIK